MDTQANLLLDGLLKLPAEERCAVAAALIDSLEGAERATASQLWRSELLKRRKSLRSGRMAAQPWAEVRARIKAL